MPGEVAIRREVDTERFEETIARASRPSMITACGENSGATIYCFKLERKGNAPLLGDRAHGWVEAHVTNRRPAYP
jgi:hypothetical protein